MDKLPQTAKELVAYADALERATLALREFQKVYDEGRHPSERVLCHRCGALIETNGKEVVPMDAQR